MQTFYEILRAMLWGCSLLVMLTLIGGGVIITQSLSSDYRSIQYTQMAAAALESIRDDVTQIVKLQDTTRWVEAGVSTADALDQIRSRVQSINAKTESICAGGGGCVKTYDDRYLVKEYLKPDGSADKRWAKDLQGQLERRADQKQNDKYNTEVIVKLVMAIAVIALSLVLLVSLMRYKKLEWRGVLLNHLVILPLLLIAAAVSGLQSEREYGQINNMNEALLTIFGSVLYLFVIYPAIIVTARRANLSIRDSLRVWR